MNFPVHICCFRLPFLFLPQICWALCSKQDSMLIWMFPICLWWNNSQLNWLGFFSPALFQFSAMCGQMHIFSWVDFSIWTVFPSFGHFVNYRSSQSSTFCSKVERLFSPGSLSVLSPERERDVLNIFLFKSCFSLDLRWAGLVTHLLDQLLHKTFKGQWYVRQVWMKLTRVFDTGGTEGLSRRARTWTSFFCLYSDKQRNCIGRSNDKLTSRVVLKCLKTLIQCFGFVRLLPFCSEVQ